MSQVANARPPMSTESTSTTYRVVILNANGTKIRVVLNHGCYDLPSVTVPHGQRIAENLTNAVKNEWGQEVIYLFTANDPTAEEKGGYGYEVTEHWRTSGTPRLPTRWEPVSGILQDSFVDQCDYLAVVQGVARCEAEMQNRTGPFTRLGWFHDLCRWVESTIAPYGLHLNERFRQFNASSSFNLVRFETNSSAVWFKAVGEPNQNEFPITCTLTKLFPRYLPAMLGVRPVWNGWLAKEAEGVHLSETEDIALWEQAASNLAKLQIESMENCPPVLSAGAHDQRTSTLSGQVAPFIEAATCVMEKQSRVPPAVLSVKELRQLGDHIRIALDLLRDSGLPDTLGHSDLNPGNIIVSRQSCTFLDWAEAYIGNPFFSFQYFLEHFRRSKGADSTNESRLIESYRRPWRRVVPPDAIAGIFSFIPLLAVFAYAVGTGAWTDGQRLREGATAAYLRSLTRRMNRESVQLKGTKPLCLS